MKASLTSLPVLYPVSSIPYLETFRHSTVLSLKAKLTSKGKERGFYCRVKCEDGMKCLHLVPDGVYVTADSPGNSSSNNNVNNINNAHNANSKLKEFKNSTILNVKSVKEGGVATKGVALTVQCKSGVVDVVVDGYNAGGVRIIDDAGDVLISVGRDNRNRGKEGGAVGGKDAAASYKDTKEIDYFKDTCTLFDVTEADCRAWDGLEVKGGIEFMKHCLCKLQRERNCADFSSFVEFYRSKLQGVIDRGKDSSDFTCYMIRSSSSSSSSFENVDVTKPITLQQCKEIAQPNDAYLPYNPMDFLPDDDGSIVVCNVLAPLPLVLGEVNETLESGRFEREYDKFVSKHKDKVQRLRDNLYVNVNSIRRNVYSLKVASYLVQRHEVVIGKVFMILNAMSGSGEKWEMLNEMVKRSRDRGDVEGTIISDVNWDDGRVVIDFSFIEKSEGLDGRVSEYTNDDDVHSTKIAPPLSCSGEPSTSENEPMKHKLDYRITTGQNLEVIYAEISREKRRLTKAVDSVDFAVESAVKKGEAKLTSRKAALDGARKTVKVGDGDADPYGKYAWFITSDSHLVLHSTDEGTKKAILEKHASPNDVVVGNDDDGNVCVVKCKAGKVGDIGINQACNYLSLTSSDNFLKKVILPSYHTRASSLITRDSTGSELRCVFRVDNKDKVYVRGGKLVMGYGIVFRMKEPREEEGGGDVGEQVQGEGSCVEEAALDDDEDDDDCVDDEAEDGDCAEEAGVNDADVVTPDVDQTEHNEVEGQVEEQEDSLGVKRLESCTIDGAPVAVPPLPPPREDDGADNEESLNEASNNKKKGLSAHDRKMIKKYGSLELAREARERNGVVDGGKGNGKGKASDTFASDGHPLPPARPQRGGKLSKKKQRKYQDQDDEDRQLAMLALHGNGGQAKGKKARGKQRGQKRTASKDDKAAVEAARKQALEDAIQGLEPEVQLLLNNAIETARAKGTECLPITPSSVAYLSSLDSEAGKVAALTRLRSLCETTEIYDLSRSLNGIIRTIAKHGYEGMNAQSDARQERKGNECGDAPRVTNDDKKVHVDQEKNLKLWTGNPKVGDTLLYAKPVLAPYAALATYKYRVKLTPGRGKRGKIAKQCLSYMKSTSRPATTFQGQGCHSPDDVKALLDKELKLIESIADNDAANACMANATVSAPGINKIIKKDKKKKDGAKKAKNKAAKGKKK